jgi:hypothetical protein
MSGISFLVDDEGRKTAAVIDLRQYQRLSILARKTGVRIEM